MRIDVALHGLHPPRLGQKNLPKLTKRPLYNIKLNISKGSRETHVWINDMRTKEEPTQCG